MELPSTAWPVVGAGLSAAVGVVTARMGVVTARMGVVGGATALASACRKSTIKACVRSLPSLSRKPMKRATLTQNSGFNQFTLTPLYVVSSLLHHFVSLISSLLHHFISLVSLLLYRFFSFFFVVDQFTLTPLYQFSQFTLIPLYLISSLLHHFMWSVHSHTTLSV